MIKLCAAKIINASENSNANIIINTDGKIPDKDSKRSRKTLQQKVAKKKGTHEVASVVIRMTQK